MASRLPEGTGANSADERSLRALLDQLWTAWNERSAAAYAALFAEDGQVIGFDGSQMNGRATIAAELTQICASHATAAYVGKVRTVRFVAPEAAVLCAIAGMVPPGKAEINPAVNTIQTLVAMKQSGAWQIVLFQNTPAQFHGRPELTEQMTEELRQLL